MAYPLVEKEWRRLLRHLKRHGAEKTCAHVLSLIKNHHPYPLAFTTRLVERFLKQGDYDSAGKIIEAVGRTGVKNPLMDELRGSWLWCIGKHKSALAFGIRSAKFWRKSYLFNHVGALYDLIGKRNNSDRYRKKSAEYRRLAVSYAKAEEEARSLRGQKRTIKQC